MKDFEISALPEERVSFGRDILSVPVIVAALGYFVDIYDLILFSIVRVQSLKAIGLSGQELLDKGVFLLNMQMAGMLLGGILWGILGDKKGRVKILFGSIFLYSIANIANGFVESIEGYAVWRFIAGIGLAGELGAGVTLVLENLPRHSRGYGTMIVATVGVSGAVLANYVAKAFDWRMAYFIGGGLGMALLIMRISVYESGMYKRMEEKEISRGNFFSLFTNRKRFFKYMNSILIGLPIWFCVGILITFSPEFAKTMNVSGTVSAGEAVMFCYIGLVFGDFASGFLSQYLRSRKKVVFLFQILTSISIVLYFFLKGADASLFYVLSGVIGFAIGYWAIFITIAAEQFGTNIRATVASTVPNFIRGTVIPITFLFQFAKKYLGIINAGAVVGALCMLIAFYALYRLEETFDKDLNYVEE
ncbi:MAG: MFS transporter [Nitrospirae bacterium]|nr:MFS transporter [Nitrospirota bacterium]MCL5976969.1 MFS transporter [Nitrospirota bacterium]